MKKSWIAYGIAGLVGVALLVLSQIIITTSCVVEGTLVDTPGGQRRIEELCLGDEVWSQNPSGLLEVGNIVKIHRSQDREYLEITFSDGGALKVTEAHPIAVRDGWRNAGVLLSGDQVRGRNGWREVTSIVNRFGRVTVFDLEVNPSANFIASGVLVHNKSSPQRRASTNLKYLAMAQADFRANDRDENKIQDYWVRDVAELHFMEPRKGELLELIERSLAEADGDSLIQRPDNRPQFGLYWYAAIPIGPNGEAYGTAKHPHRSTSGFAFCAWPATQEGSKWGTFIINQDNTVFRKDTGSKRIVRWPTDLQAGGWKPLD